MPAKSSDKKNPLAFEQRLERLEQLAEKLRDGKIPLEDAVAIFEEGMKLSQSLEKDLARVERRVEILTEEPARRRRSSGPCPVPRARRRRKRLAGQGNRPGKVNVSPSVMPSSANAPFLISRA